MDTSLPPEVIDQVHMLADYARKNGYAQVTIMPSRKAYFKREGSPLLTRESWENKGMAALRVIALVWMIIIMIWAYILVGTSLILPHLSLPFGWAIILLAAPWLFALVTTSALFAEGPEAKSMMQMALFLAAVFIGMGSISQVQQISVLLYGMGVPCLALAYLTDFRRAAA